MIFKVLLSISLPNMRLVIVSN